MKTPRVSIIMSIYKESTEWIKLTVDSILTQSYEDFELIVASDAPDYKEGCALLDHYAEADKRVKIIHNVDNIGLTKTLNKLLLYASGDYIARIDADDIACRDRLKNQVEYLNSHSNIGLCHTNYRIINEYGTVIKTKAKQKENCGQEWLVWENVVAHPTVMFRKELLSLRVHFYNEQYRSAQDYELWSFLTLKGVKFGFLDDILLEYRVSSAQVSTLNRPKQLKNFCAMRKKYIYQYLIHKGCRINKDTSIKECFQELNSSRALFSSNDLFELDHILYLLYYNLVGGKLLYLLRYLFDKQELVSKFSIKKSLYITLRCLGMNRWDIYNI